MGPGVGVGCERVSTCSQPRYIHTWSVQGTKYPPTQIVISTQCLLDTPEMKSRVNLTHLHT